MLRRPPRSTLFPYTTLFRSRNAFGDLRNSAVAGCTVEFRQPRAFAQGPRQRVLASAGTDEEKDRKSTRLNSSHVRISYAVFCLKKKKNKKKITQNKKYKTRL